MRIALGSDHAGFELKQTVTGDNRRLAGYLEAQLNRVGGGDSVAHRLDTAVSRPQRLME